MIFVDTSAFFPLYNSTDAHHKTAMRIAGQLKEEGRDQVTSNIVVGETLTLLSMRVSKSTAVQFGKLIIQSGLHIFIIDQDLHASAWEIFQSLKNKDVSFFDCTSFAIMKSMGIQTAFSFDKDFKDMGFVLLS